ncbi:suppressor of cytokine signaling 2-like [Pteronotus mesoamericanus]|uniref:suppressor of cytokine signaling 2-like n=1 Tax=Pteronotus mesoamericanus TaxID=1884717 RepID=UPI0023EBDFFF|nr:suppressor of cytokine signaling 2-like [Pteronotus parnellii mesoamericanus]
MGEGPSGQGSGAGAAWGGTSRGGRAWKKGRGVGAGGLATGTVRAVQCENLGFLCVRVPAQPASEGPRIRGVLREREWPPRRQAAPPTPARSGGGSGTASGPGCGNSATRQLAHLAHLSAILCTDALGGPTDFRKDACRSLTANSAATAVCRGDPSPVTLRSLERPGNGVERTRSRWGSAVSAEELSPRQLSPEAARLAKAWQELGETGWYWGSMTVSEAKEKLQEAPEGTFLIRDSSHSDFLLTISVKTSAGPTNLRIEYQDGKFRLDSIVCVKSQLKQFDSAVHLIEYYVQMCKDKRVDPEAHRSGAVHLYLTKPLYTSAPPLQHLCRLSINKCTSAVWELPLPTRLKDYLEEYKFQI